MITIFTGTNGDPFFTAFKAGGWSLSNILTVPQITNSIMVSPSATANYSIGAFNSTTYLPGPFAASPVGLVNDYRLVTGGLIIKNATAPVNQTGFYTAVDTHLDCSFTSAKKVSETFLTNYPLSSQVRSAVNLDTGLTYLPRDPRDLTFSPFNGSSDDATWISVGSGISYCYISGLAIANTSFVIEACLNY